MAGLLLITSHLLELAFAGSATTVAGVIVIVAVPVAAVVLQPRVSRLTRFSLCLVAGLACVVLGGLAHVLDLFTSGPRWTDVTGVAFAAGGALVVASGCVAAAGMRRSRPRLGRAVLWVVGAFLVGQFVVLPLISGLIVTHAARLPVDAGALRAPHRTVAIASPEGTLAGWYAPTRNGAAVLVVHGSGSNRSKVARQAQLVADRGYGVLSLDLPGHGDSDGHAHLLGGNAQPAIRAALDWLTARRGVDTARIAGFGMSLGGEVLLEAAARDRRLAAVVSDGAERASDDRELDVGSSFEQAVGFLSRQVTRAVSGEREPEPLLGLLPRIAPRPLLLIAAGGRPDEIPVNRAYRAAAGASAELWEIPEAGHTKGLEARPAEYARRVTAFLDRAIASR